MNTINEWLHLLPEPARTQARNNMEAEVENRQVGDIKTALFRAFEWAETKEGENYWKGIHKGLNTY